MQVVFSVYKQTFIVSYSMWYEFYKSSLRLTWYAREIIRGVGIFFMYCNGWFLILIIWIYSEQPRAFLFDFFEGSRGAEF